MCIVLLTTAHPHYAYVVIDNRDEFILRPTSRPHWWTTHPKPVARSSASDTDTATYAPGSLNGIKGDTCSGTTADTDADGARRPYNAQSSIYNNNNGEGNKDSSSNNGQTGLTGKQQSHSQLQEDLPKRISVLCSRDLQRPEHGTWFGITRQGHFAVLTNYRETNPNDMARPICAARSRGEMVTAWMAADPAMSLDEFVRDMLVDGSTKGVGGFSLLCGKLRRRRALSNKAEKKDDMTQVDGIPQHPHAHAELAVISNRYDTPDEAPRVATTSGQTIGLSNTCYGYFDVVTTPEDRRKEREAYVRVGFTPEDCDDYADESDNHDNDSKNNSNINTKSADANAKKQSREWPKVVRGKALLEEVIAKHVAQVASQINGNATTAAATSDATASALAREEDAFVEQLFGILDTDTLPRNEGLGFEHYIYLLKHSVFIPAIGDKEHRMEMEEACKVAHTPLQPSTSQRHDSSCSGGKSYVEPYFLPPPKDRSAATNEGKEGGQATKANQNDKMGFAKGLYGTQRQTVMLVDWNGNVRFTERALWDACGRPIRRGKGDITFRFTIDGWNDEVD